MIRPLLAIGALVVLAAVEARYEDGGRVSYKHEEHYSYEPYGDNKYDDGYGKKHVAYAKSYKHEPEHYEEYEEPSYGKYDHKPTYKHRHSVYGYGGDSYGKSYSSYEEPTYAKSHKVPTYEVEYHDEDYGYEHKYDHKPSYNSHKYKRSVYGYSDDSYGKSYNFYGGDSYGKSYSTYSSYKPSSYRHKREEQVLVPLGIESEPTHEKCDDESMMYKRKTMKSHKIYEPTKRSVDKRDSLKAKVAEQTDMVDKEIATFDAGLSIREGQVCLPCLDPTGLCITCCNDSGRCLSCNELSVDRICLFGICRCRICCGS